MFAGVAEMMGRQAGGQERLFYSFNLETVVPENHLLRGINRCLDLRKLRELRRCRKTGQLAKLRPTGQLRYETWV